MKRLFILSVMLVAGIFFMFGCGGEETVDLSKLQERNGVVYKVNSDKPYTGTAIEFYDNGQKKMEVNIVDGKKHGEHKGWYENGQRWAEGNFKDGKEHGKIIKWHKDGKKKSEGNYKDGKLQGKYMEWDEKGNITLEKNFKDGVEIK